MFKYTKAAIEKTIDDIKTVARIFEFILAFLQIPFSVYNLAVNNGILFVNILLLIISTAYFTVFLIANHAYADTLKKEERKRWKKIKSKTKKIVSWVKRPVQLYSLGVLIYGLILSANTATPLSIILLFLQSIAFLVSLIVDILAIIIDNKKKMFLEAWEADWNDIKEPGRIVGNVVKSIFGKEPTAKPQDTKTEIILDKYIEKKEEQKKQELLAVKAEKEKEKEAKRAQKAYEKQQKKEARKNKKITKVKQLPAEEIAATEELPALPEAQPAKKKKGFFGK